MVYELYYQKKKKLSDEISSIEKECEGLDEEIMEIDNKLKEHKKEDDIHREK